MEKTIKQIADSLNLDKQKVYRFIKKNNISESHQKNGTKYYNDSSQTLIFKHFKKENTSKKSHQSASFDTVISILQEELNVKNKQIEELQNLLNQQQQLQLMEQKKCTFYWMKQKKQLMNKKRQK